MLEAGMRSASMDTTLQITTTEPAWVAAEPLAPTLLRRRCDLSGLAFKTTDDLPDLAGLVGQERAIDAVRFGTAMRRRGFNIFAFGPSGTGKHTLVQGILATQAASEETPPDWCYVNNFADPHRPLSLKLPTGRAAPFRDAMKRLVVELRAALPAAFEREDYRARREVIDEQFKHRNEEAFGALQCKAETKNIALIRTPMGLGLAPMPAGRFPAPGRGGQGADHRGHSGVAVGTRSHGAPHTRLGAGAP
jgi:hypothetical protein